MKNNNSIIQSKSLFISGDPINVPFVNPDIFTLSECINITTSSPTLQPTHSPIGIDTESIIFDRDYIKLSIAFEYEIQKNETSPTVNITSSNSTNIAIISMKYLVTLQNHSLTKK